MVGIGNWNKLKVLRHVDFGVYLDGLDDGDILLPRREVPVNCQIGDTIDVFVCYDSEDRLVATIHKPKAQVGEFALLKVVGMSSVGAFLDWGLPKDLFLPFAEQIRALRIGQEIIVYIYLDKSDRISASMRLERFTEKSTEGLEEGQNVELIIVDKTDLGFKALIDGRYMGLIFANEVFKPLGYGQKERGFIKSVREDGKIDLSLQRTGHQAGDDIAPKILELLSQNQGYLKINDKTPAETIYDLLGVSKKKYKIALGGLYKKRLITVEEDGIRLAPKSGRK